MAFGSVRTVRDLAGDPIVGAPRTLPGLSKEAPRVAVRGGRPRGPPECGVDRPPAAPTVVGGGTGAVPWVVLVGGWPSGPPLERGGG